MRREQQFDRSLGIDDRQGLTGNVVGSGLVVGQVEGLEDHPALSAPFGVLAQPPDVHLDRPDRGVELFGERVDIGRSGPASAGGQVAVEDGRGDLAELRDRFVDLVAQTVADHRQQRDGHGHRRDEDRQLGGRDDHRVGTVDDQRADDHRNGGGRDQCRSRGRDEHADRPRCRPAVPHRAVPIAASCGSGTRHRRVDDVCGRGRSSGKSGQDDRLVADVPHSGGGSSARVGRRIGLPDTGR